MHMRPAQKPAVRAAVAILPSDRSEVAGEPETTDNDVTDRRSVAVVRGWLTPILSIVLLVGPISGPIIDFTGRIHAPFPPAMAGRVLCKPGLIKLFGRRRFIAFSETLYIFVVSATGLSAVSRVAKNTHDGPSMIRGWLFPKSHCRMRGRQEIS